MTAYDVQLFSCTSGLCDRPLKSLSGGQQCRRHLQSAWARQISIVSAPLPHAAPNANTLELCVLEPTPEQDFGKSVFEEQMTLEMSYFPVLNAKFVAVCRPFLGGHCSPGSRLLPTSCLLLLLPSQVPSKCVLFSIHLINDSFNPQPPAAALSKPLPQCRCIICFQANRNSVAISFLAPS